MLSLPEKSSLQPVVSIPHVQENLVPEKPRPILKLQGDKQDLYVELIQEASIGSYAQPMIWVRPLFLVNDEHVLDLQATSDLLWPKGAFQPAYAEDVIPLIERTMLVPEARQRLQEFIRDAWRDASGTG